MTKTTLASLALEGTLADERSVIAKFYSGTVVLDIGSDGVTFAFDEINSVINVLEQLQTEVNNRVSDQTSSSASENMLNELDDDFGDCERDPDPVFEEVDPL